MAGTALMYDEEMTRYKLLWVDPVCKVEVPERLAVSYAALQEAGLAQRCVSVPVRQATEEEVLLAHSEEYLEAVKKTPHMSLEELMTFTQQYGDVYFHPNIYRCARLAVGATLQLVDAVMKGRARNGMALVRPPGHHSQRSAANGFCVFNNVAIAALYARKHYGIRRVLIVDWDVHHGQGLQYYFEEDPDVLYFSWHRYEHQRYWPNLPESDFHMVGKGNGAGRNINLPWNKVGMDNGDYLSAFFHVLLPMAYEFGPELVLVSAGFDSAIGDPEGHMSATPQIFGHLTHLLMSLAGGRLCAILEGGYNLTSLPQSVCQTVQTLLGDPVSRLPGLSGACESALESIQCVRAAHQPYWGFLKHAAVSLVSEPSTQRCRLETAEAETQSEEEERVWPDPPARPAPPVTTAVAPPAGTEGSVPTGCVIITEPPLLSPKLEGVKDEATRQSLGNVLWLLDKFGKKEVRNGLVAVPDLRLAVDFATQHALHSLTDRVLLVFVGSEAPLELQGDGKVMVVHFCTGAQRESRSSHYIPLCLKGCEDVPGFLHAVLSLLLPLAYSYNPDLVLLAKAQGSVTVEVWAQLTSLLQGLSGGQTLALMQVGEEAEMRATLASLLGHPAPCLGPLGAPLVENMQAVETQRQRVLKHWGLLQNGLGTGES